VEKFGMGEVHQIVGDQLIMAANDQPTAAHAFAVHEGEVGDQRRIGLVPIAGREPEAAMTMDDGHGCDARMGWGRGGKGIVDAGAVAIETQPMIGAMDDVAVDLSLAQGHEAVRAAIPQHRLPKRKSFPLPGAIGR
jgi:hypothetical protein